MMPPRIRGRAGQIAEGKHKDKWVYEASLWTFDGETQIGDCFQIGPFDTEEMACDEGRKMVRLMSETVEKSLDGEVSGKYLDMKNGGVLRPWENNS